MKWHDLTDELRTFVRKELDRESSRCLAEARKFAGMMKGKTEPGEIKLYESKFKLHTSRSEALKAAQEVLLGTLMSNDDPNLHAHLQNTLQRTQHLEADLEVYKGLAERERRVREEVQAALGERDAAAAKFRKEIAAVEAEMDAMREKLHAARQEAEQAQSCVRFHADDRLLWGVGVALTLAGAAMGAFLF